MSKLNLSCGKCGNDDIQVIIVREGEEVIGSGESGVSFSCTSCGRFITAEELESEMNVRWAERRNRMSKA